MDIDALLQDAYVEMAAGLNTEGGKETLKELALTHPGPSELLRMLQIMQESLDIALTSPNIETAEYRMGLAEEMLRQTTIVYRVLTTKKTKDEIRRIFACSSAGFHTAKYLNNARHNFKISRTKKTAKSRTKYLTMAREILKIGVADPKTNKDKLTTLLGMLDAY